MKIAEYIWEGLFEPHILERGRACCMAGNVRDLAWDEDTLTAVVLGREEYDVEIFWDGVDIGEMSCTCPYAEDGTPCKHMAAVLYAQGTEETVPAQVRFPWEETLSSLSKEELLTFLTELISQDENLQELLVLRYGQPDPELQMDSWEDQVHKILRKHSNGRGYVEYRNADDFHLDMDAFLDRRLDTLLNAGKALEAFGLVSLVYETVMETGAEGTHDYLFDVTNRCEEAWPVILKHLPEAQTPEVHQWFVSKLHGVCWPYGNENVEDFLFSHPWPRPQLEKNLHLLNREIAKADMQSNPPLTDLSRREDTMRRLGYSEEAIEALWQNYQDFPFFRERKLEQLLEEGAHYEAIKLLLECKEKDRDDDWKMEEHSKKLIALYQITGREAEYREELRFQVFSFHQQDLKYVHQLRAVTSQEAWPMLLETLLELPTLKWQRLELLAFGEKWQRLMDTLRAQHSLEVLNKYADRLAAWDAGQVLACYRELLNQAMDRASDRKAYGEVVGYLKRIRSYSGGKTVAMELASHWRMRYPRRRAMLEELQKAGA